MATGPKLKSLPISMRTTYTGEGGCSSLFNVGVSERVDEDGGCRCLIHLLIQTLQSFAGLLRCASLVKECCARNIVKGVSLRRSSH